MRYVGEFRVAIIKGSLYLCIITSINDQGTRDESLVTNVVAKLFPGRKGEEIELLENPIKITLKDTGSVPQWVIDCFDAARSKKLDPEVKEYSINGVII